MKILFVTDLCPIQENEKGLPLTLLNFMTDFIELGYEVVLLRPNVVLNVLLRKRRILKEGEYFYKGVRCINKNFMTPFFRPCDFKFLENEKFDAIISHMPSGVLAANKISKLLKIPYFAAVHASDIKVLTDFKYSFLKNDLINAYIEAKNVVCRSYWLKDKIEDIIKNINDKTYVVPSGIEANAIIGPDKFDLKVEEFSKLPLKIFSAGSLIKRKNFDSLIKAISKTEETKLVIAGDGCERKRLERLVCQLGLSNRVEFVGQKTKNEIYDFMEKYPVFILPSFNETFGMVYLEAMAKASIVVCLENSGMAGFIQNAKNGFLTKGDPFSIAFTIDEIKELKNPEIIMQNALNTAIELDRLKMAKNYINLIQNILF